jgi:hypothetical protein
MSNEMASNAEASYSGWRSTFNITERTEGTGRSITGYGAESLITGRALVCGYNLFFKAWRDSKYDAVLEANKVLFRVEFKGTSTRSLTLTSGGRAGKQISRSAGSREQVLSTEDSEILIGIDSACGICWIIPTEIIMILKKKQISITQIDSFKEKWRLMFFLASHPDECRLLLSKGVSHLTENEYEAVVKAYGRGRRPKTCDNPFSIGKHVFSGINKKALNVWKLIYDEAK